MSPRTGSGSGRRRDDGSSVTELAVAVLVGSILLAVIATVFVGTTRAVRAINVSTASVADARRAMEAVSRTLRVAAKPDTTTPAVLSAGPAGMSFWALLNRTGAPSTVEPAPTLVTYAYDGTCLRETQVRGGSTSTVCLVRTSRPPVFSYYATGSLAAGAATAPLGSASGVPAADLPTIRSVEIALTVKDRARPDLPAVPVVQRVTLQNLVMAGG